MNHFIDLTGKTFGRLKVIKLTPNDKKGAYWLCECLCGKKTIVRTDKLVRGTTKSCGCYRKEKMIQRNTKHNLSRSNIYRRYKTILNRCYYEKNSLVKNHYYKDRNINVCDEWLGENGFINFYNWAINNGYDKKLTIDRIDNNKGYSPNNCRWVTWKEQRRNQRPHQRNGEWKKLNELDKLTRKAK